MLMPNLLVLRIPSMAVDEEFSRSLQLVLLYKRLEIWEPQSHLRGSVAPFWKLKTHQQCLDTMK